MTSFQKYFFLFRIGTENIFKIYKIKLPAKNVTNCAFGGANNNDLYITTALKGLKEIDKQKYNLSGSLFKVRTNSKGMTSKSFNVIYD